MRGFIFYTGFLDGPLNLLSLLSLLAHLSKTATRCARSCIAAQSSRPPEETEGNRNEGDAQQPEVTVTCLKEYVAESSKVDPAAIQTLR